MEKEIFIIWNNYDGNVYEKFPETDLKSVKKRIIDIKKKELTDDYGTRLLHVIYGKEYII